MKYYNIFSKAILYLNFQNKYIICQCSSLFFTVSQSFRWNFVWIAWNMFFWEWAFVQIEQIKMGRWWRISVFSKKKWCIIIWILCLLEDLKWLSFWILWRPWTNHSFIETKFYSLFSPRKFILSMFTLIRRNIYSLVKRRNIGFPCKITADFAWHIEMTATHTVRVCEAWLHGRKGNATTVTSPIFVY